MEKESYIGNRLKLKLENVFLEIANMRMSREAVLRALSDRVNTEQRD